MPERVVDVLETVDVDHQRGELRTFAAGLGEAAREALGEQVPVRNAGQVIGPRQLVQALLHLLALADVA